MDAPEKLRRGGYIKVANDVAGLAEAPKIPVENIETAVSGTDIGIDMDSVQEVSQSMMMTARQISVAFSVTMDNLLAAVRVIRRALQGHIPIEYSGYRIVNHRGRNKIVPIKKNGMR